MTQTCSWIKCTCSCKPCGDCYAIFHGTKSSLILKWNKLIIWQKTLSYDNFFKTFYSPLKAVPSCYMLLIMFNFHDIRPLLHDKSQLIMSCKLRIEHLSWCVPKYTRLVVVLQWHWYRLYSAVHRLYMCPSVPFGSSLQLIAIASVQILSAKRVSFLQVALVGGKTSTIDKRGKLFKSCLLVHREGKFVFLEKRL